MKEIEVRSGGMKVFLQYSDDIIILGSSESGLYLLKYDDSGKTYSIQHLLPMGKIQYQVTGLNSYIKTLKRMSGSGLRKD